MAIAVADGFARPRARLSGLDASTTLEHFALVTFDVDPDRLAASLPRDLTPEVRTLDDGRRRGFVSAVSFRDVDFRFAIAPALRVSFFQTNYRAYVIGPDGERAVYFFGTTLDSPLAAFPRHVWWMPWHRGADADRRGVGRGRAVRLVRPCLPRRLGRGDRRARGLEPSPPAASTASPTPTTRRSSSLTRSTAGSGGPTGGLGRYEVWHERLMPQLGTAHRARYAVFERLGLVAEDQPPHSVLLQRAVEFDVHLPPTTPL